MNQPDELDDRDPNQPELPEDWDGDEWAREYDERDGAPEGDWDR